MGEMILPFLCKMPILFFACLDPATAFTRSTANLVSTPVAVVPLRKWIREVSLDLFYCSSLG